MVLKRFLLHATAWSVGLAALLVVLAAVAGDEPVTAAVVVRWTARAVVLAGFPAGFAVAPSFRDEGFRHGAAVLRTLGGGVLLGSAVLLLAGFVAPMLDRAAEPSAMTIGELWSATRMPADDTLLRNQQYWHLYSPLISAYLCAVHALLGLLVGLWTRSAVAPRYHRTAAWAVGFGLLFAEFAAAENTFELILVRLQGELSSAAVVPAVVPTALLVGAVLPTIAVLRRRDLFA